MKQGSDGALRQIVDLRQLGDTAEEIHAALADPEVFEAIFGEPSDEEIAEAIRQASAEYEAGDYKAALLDKADDEPYRTPTKQEILEGIKQGFKEALAGDVLTEEQFRKLLNE